MKFIKILPEGLIDRIAAGEVIENPASVVKELVENSIDAGSTNIEIAIAGGGKEEIIIVDDGEGIPKDQVELAFYRHATSKIRNWDDLLCTGTMGFRGEALPSISSVSILELTTFFAGETTGTRIRFEGGKQVFLGPCPSRKGCAISVKNIFYNVPARRKFLKSDLSEKRKINEIIRRYIIAHPEIGFTIGVDGKSSSTLTATDSLLSRLENVWGDAVAGSLIPVESGKIGPLEIRGFASKPEMTRASRSEIFFFVNRRPVLERALFGAIAASYGRALPPGRFPYAAVFLDIDTSFVDINVHPAKTEVRFADDGFIFTTLKRTLDKALSLPVGLVIRALEPRVDTPREIILNHDKAADEIHRELFTSGEFPMKPHPSWKTEPGDLAKEAFPSVPPLAPREDPFLQIFETFIVTRLNNELVIIDQHTAHERILFERTLGNLDKEGSPSQKMLFEERVKLTPRELSLVSQSSMLLSKAGFEIRDFGNDEVIVSGMPQEMSRFSPEKVLKDVLSVLGANLNEGQEIKRALASAVACKAAVKAGDKLTGPHMKNLLETLLHCNEPYRCPHGRPTIVTLSLNDLEKIFRRK